MKILLFGSEGQVGRELQRSLALLGSLVSCSRNEINLLNHKQIKQGIKQHKPDIVVNAAAYTAVDKAEEESETAFAINLEAVKLIAGLCEEYNSTLVHYSTDYVFDGKKQSPYEEHDDANPLSVYGESKLQGEIAIKNSGCLHLILRTSWVYSLQGNNFIKTMLRLANERDVLSIVDDQVGSPTSAEMIADTTALLLYHVLLNKNRKNGMMGTYHLTAGGETSWYGLACYIFDYAKELGACLRIEPKEIYAVSSDDYPQKARRPLNSRLDTSKLQEKFNLFLPTWQYHVNRLLTQIYTK